MRQPKPHELLESADDGWVTRERALVVVLAVATALAFFLCFELVRPFLPALAWAVALAVVARPVFTWIAARVPNGSVAAGLTVALVAFLLIAPSLLVVRQLVLEASESIEQTQANIEAGRWRVAEQIPWLAPILDWINGNLDLRGEIPRALQGFLGNVTELLKGSVWAIAQLLLTLFTLYFFFRDRRAIMRAVRSLAPLSESETDDVLRRVNDTIHATVYGTLLVSLVQGFLGGLMFWMLGLPGPIIWGLVMALLAIVPYFGAFVVWAPAAAYLALDGHWGKALLLTGWGTIVVGLVDNLLYPVFVGKRLKLHTLLAFLAIIGGLAVFGAAGVVLGPVILAITIALIEVWQRRMAGGRAAEDGVNLPPERIEKGIERKEEVAIAGDRT